MLSKVLALLGILLCITNIFPSTEAFHQLRPTSSNLRQLSLRNYRFQTAVKAFPLEDMVLIEHSSLGIRRGMRWDEATKTFQQGALSESVKQTQLLNFFKNCFVPSGAISSDYYTYSLWRSAQRFVSATSSVFGTQALLLALGFKSNKIGIAAATTWVLKDALGKVSRIFWASKHGRKFDSDAKKWRFRSSILFATGNGLEIFTYIVPSMFLLTAALANALKQMAMLTSSATRNTIYKSFARSSDNIGDITAKGEAQIAVIDLLGMSAGVMISRAIGASRSKISGIFLGLSIFDLICIFKEIKSVIFTTLNFERMNIVLGHLFAESNGKSFSEAFLSDGEKVVSKVSREKVVADGERGSSYERGLDDLENAKVSVREDIGAGVGTGVRAGGVQGRAVLVALTPVEVAVVEPILLPTSFGEDIFRSWSSVDCSTEVLRGALDLFAGRSSGSSNGSEGKLEGGETSDKFIVTVSARVPKSWMDAKKTEIGWQQSSSVLRSVGGVPVIFSPQILLHVNATQFDVFRASFIVRNLLHEFKTMSEAILVSSVGPKISKLNSKNTEIGEFAGQILPSIGLGSEGLLAMIKNAKTFEKKNMRDCVNLLRTAGWDVGKFTFGTLRTRVEW